MIACSISALEGFAILLHAKALNNESASNTVASSVVKDLTRQKRTGFGEWPAAAGRRHMIGFSFI
jgi:hypothetical protein